MRLVYILLLSVVLVFTVTCKKTSDSTQFNCIIGNTYKVSDSMSFVIDSLNDSRCLPGMECIWAGQVILYMNISTGGALVDTTFYIRSSGMIPVIIGGYSFKADSVYPFSSGTTKSKKITVKMTILPVGS